MIGKLEEIVLLAVLRAGPDAMPSDIYEHICDTAPTRPPGFGAVYTTLNRMAAKQLVKLVAITDGNGRSRKAFSISMIGQDALRDAVSHAAALGAYSLAGG